LSFLGQVAGEERQTELLATTAGTAKTSDSSWLDRRVIVIDNPLQAGVPPNTPDRRILAAGGAQCHAFIENSK